MRNGAETSHSVTNGPASQVRFESAWSNSRAEALYAVPPRVAVTIESNDVANSALAAIGEPIPGDVVVRLSGSPAFAARLGKIVVSTACRSEPSPCVAFGST